MSRKAILRHSIDALKELENVVGGGLGKRIKNGSVIDEDVIHVFVTEKRNVHPAHKIPPRIWMTGSKKSAPTDVIEVGHLQPLSNRDTTRPILGGLSVSNPLDFSIGTLGGIFKDNTDDMPVMVSNNHVFARSNAASLGETITQPGLGDDVGGGTVGSLKRFIPLDFVGINHVDGAVASISITNDIDIAVTNVGLMRTAATGLPDINKLVQKSGRTSEHSFGVVLSTDAFVSVDYGGAGIADFDDQIVTTQMLLSGDSGSLLFSTQNELIGLGYAGSDEASVWSPLADVLSELDVSPYDLIRIVTYQDPIRGGFFYKSDIDPVHDPLYTLNHGCFFLHYSEDLSTDHLAPFKRWRTTSYPYKYALSTVSPGAGFSEHQVLGKIATMQLEGTVPLMEWLDASRNSRFYTTDPAGGGIDTGVFVEQPTPVGYVAAVEVPGPVI